MEELCQLLLRDASIQFAVANVVVGAVAAEVAADGSVARR